MILSPGENKEETTFKPRTYLMQTLFISPPRLRQDNSFHGLTCHVNLAPTSPL